MRIKQTVWGLEKLGRTWKRGDLKASAFFVMTMDIITGCIKLTIHAIHNVILCVPAYHNTLLYNSVAFLDLLDLRLSNDY